MRLVQATGEAAVAADPQGAALPCVMDFHRIGTHRRQHPLSNGLCGKRRHQWVKLSVMVLCGSFAAFEHLPGLGTEQRPVPGSCFDCQSLLR